MTVQTPPPSPTVLEQGARVDWAPVPRVNLLPPEIIAARRFAAAQRLMAGAVAAALLLAGAGIAWSSGQVNSAQDQLDQARASAAQLQAEQAAYADVPLVLAQLDAAKAARAQVLAQDIDWSPLLSDLAVAVPSRVWLTSLQVAVQPASSAGSDPLVPAGIGVLTVAGSGESFPDVAAWLKAVVKVPGLDSSTLQTATRGTGTSSASTAVTFTSRVQLTKDALSHRFDQKAG